MTMTGVKHQVRALNTEWDVYMLSYFKTYFILILKRLFKIVLC